MNNFYIQNEETDIVMNLTHDQILTVKNTLGINGDELADMLTGLNCDSYADKIEEILSEGESIDEAIEYDEDGYQTCRSYHRIMNYNLTDEQCEEAWVESCLNSFDQ